MKIRSIRNTVFVAAVLLALLIPVALWAQGHEHMQHHDASHAPNALVQEMIKLDAVFREVVSGVAMADGARVHKALEAMHGTMEKTHEEVGTGHVTLKKNADKLPQFVAMDKTFHASLEQLAHAAHEGNQERMLTITQGLLKGCVQCHQDYK